MSSSTNYYAGGTNTRLHRRWQRVDFSSCAGHRQPSRSSYAHPVWQFDVASALWLAILQLRLFKGNCLPKRFLWEVGEDEKTGCSQWKRWRRLGQHKLRGRQTGIDGAPFMLGRRWPTARAGHALGSTLSSVESLACTDQVAIKFSRTVCFLARSQSGRRLNLWQAVRCPVTGRHVSSLASTPTRPREPACARKKRPPQFLRPSLAKELRSTFRTDDQKEMCRTDSAQLGRGKRNGGREDSGKEGKKKKKTKKRKKKPTARGIPRRSPIQVLIPPDGAWLRWSDENRCFHRGMAVDICFRSNACTHQKLATRFRAPSSVRTQGPHHRSRPLSVGLSNSTYRC